MINFMVANLQEKKGLYRRINKKRLLSMLKTQIENSLDVGWNKEKILVMSNFDFEFMGVKTHQCELNNTCLTGSKMFGLLIAFEQGLITEEVWSHDLDAWQNIWFESPEFLDVGVVPYYESFYHGASVFFRPGTKHIVTEIVDRVTRKNTSREEPSLNRVLKSKKYKDRVTVLDNTYNVGCTRFVKRYMKSEKPVRVCHFRPFRRIAWRTFVLDSNNIFNGENPVSVRLEKIMRKYFPGLATEFKK